MGSGGSKSGVKGGKSSGKYDQHGPPYWTTCLYIDPEMTGGLSAVSDGLAHQSANEVMRTRKGAAIADAARWCKGVESGKHVFHCVWPMKSRGTDPCIGLGTGQVPLQKAQVKNIIGDHSLGYGLNL